MLDEEEEDKADEDSLLIDGQSDLNSSMRHSILSNVTAPDGVTERGQVQKDNVKVVIRCRPLNERELSK